jgi:hypothetical protein
MDRISNVPCKDVQADEIWRFIGKKERNKRQEAHEDSLGDCYTWVAIERHTKFVLAFRIHGRIAFGLRFAVEHFVGEVTGVVVLRWLRAFDRHWTPATQNGVGILRWDPAKVGYAHRDLTQVLVCSQYLITQSNQ